MSSSKNKPLAAFDIDGTIFRNSLLIELHWKMVRRGLIPRATISRLDKLYWAWVRREGSYTDYLQEVVDNFQASIKKQLVRDIQSAAKRVVEVQSDITYRYTRDLVRTLKKTHTLVAISGSPTLVAEAFAKKWNFDYVLATEYEIEDKQFTGNMVSVPFLDKGKALREFVGNRGFTLKNSIGIGDTESDIGIFELVDEPICFNPTAKLYEIARAKGWKIVVERKDVIYQIEKGTLVN